MKPLLCYSIENLKGFSFEDYPFGGYEFRTNEMGGFKPNILILLKIKEMFNGKNLSLHSQLGRIFSCNDRGYPEFNEAELDLLKAEIIISKIIGIKQINIHMKETEFTPEEIEKFNQIIDFAYKNGIEIIYENHVCSEEIILRVLETFPSINFCLDIGHLNVAIHNGKFKMDLEEFIERIKLRLVNIHAHNNFGEKDEHNSLIIGNFLWKDLLDNLKDSNLRKIIIECRSKEDSIQSKKILEEYYSPSLPKK